MTEYPHSKYSPHISIRIILDNMRPFHRAALFLFLAILIITWIFLQINIFPSEYIFKTNQTQLNRTNQNTCDNPSGFINDTLICEPFTKFHPTLGLILRDISPLNQFALISLEFHNHSSTNPHLNFLHQNISVELYELELSVSDHLGKFIKKSRVGVKSMILDGSEASDTFIYSKIPLQHIIGLYRNLNSQNYLLTIKFSSGEQIVNQKVDPYLKAYLVNSSSTLLTIIIRIILFVLSLLFFSTFFYFYFKISPESRLVEQKLVFFLSVSLLIFNDPLYFFTVIRPNSFNTIFSIFSFIQIIACIFFYLICSFRKILHYQTQNLSSVFSLVKKWEIALFFATFFSIIGFLISELAVKQYKSEVLLYPFQISPVLTILTLCWLGIFITYLIYLMVKCCDKGKVLWRSSGWISVLTFILILLVLYLLILEVNWPEKSRSLYVTAFLAFVINIICYCNQVLFISIPNNEQNKFVNLGEEQLSIGNSVDIELDSRQ